MGKYSEFTTTKIFKIFSDKVLGVPKCFLGLGESKIDIKGQTIRIPI